MKAYADIWLLSKNGGGGIRTHGTLADTLVFKTRALNHSTTPPGDSKYKANPIILAEGWKIYSKKN